MESSATPINIFNAQAVSAGVYRSANIVVGGRDALSIMLQALGDIAAAVLVEVSNSSDDQIADHAAFWTTYDAVTITALATAQLVVDTADIEFFRFADASPDLTAALATAAALPSCTASGSGVGKTLTATANGVLTVDGTAVALNDVVLVKNQVNPRDNGLYTCTTAGAGGAAFVLTRHTSLDANAEMVTGKTINVTGGSTQSGGWVLAGPPIGIVIHPEFRLARLRLNVTGGSGVVNAQGYARGL